MIDEESTTYKEPTKCILMCAMRPTTLLWDCCLVRLHHGCPDRDQMMGWHSHHIGNVILPFDEVRQISRWWNCTTNQIYVFVASQITFCFFLVQLILQWFWPESEHWLSPSPGKEECDKAGSVSSVRRLQLVVPMDPGQKERKKPLVSWNMRFFRLFMVHK